MNSVTVPYLCGGILLELLLQARPPRTNAREKTLYGTDGLSEPDLMNGLINVVTGSESSVAGDSLKKAASQYKSCKTNGNTYITFAETPTIVSFDSLVKSKDSILFARVSEFIDRFIDPNKAEWLVQALIEVITADTEINDTDEFAIGAEKNTSKSNLSEIQLVELQPFLISVLHYVIMNRQDNTKGKPTFDSWNTKNKKNATWKFISNIGSNAKHPITVTTSSDSTTPDDLKDASHEHENEESGEKEDCSNAETNKDPDGFSNVQIINNPTIVNQNGENNIQINHINNLKL